MPRRLHPFLRFSRRNFAHFGLHLVGLSFDMEHYLLAHLSLASYKTLKLLL